MTKVLVIGDGRMGTIIRELVEADESLELTGVIGIDNKDELADVTPTADVAIACKEPYPNRNGQRAILRPHDWKGPRREIRRSGKQREATGGY